MMTNIKTLDGKVRATLEADPKSRNDDIRLTQMVWWRYYRDDLKMIGDSAYVNVASLHKLPREDNIKRVRAKIQNVEHKFLPTDPAVAIKRGWNEETWRSYLGYGG